MGAMLLASASIVFAVTSVAGSVRIKGSWSERYEGHKILGNFAFGPALAQASIQNARETATVGKIQALPIVGPSFERFDIIDKSGLSDAHWWQSVQRLQPQAIIASNMARDNSVSSKELRVRESGLYKLVFDKQGVRIYVPSAT